MRIVYIRKQKKKIFKKLRGITSDNDEEGSKVDMNSLLSGLANSQSNGNKCGKKDGCNNNNGFGGSSIIWIIILFFIFCGLGQGRDCGTVCGCERNIVRNFVDVDQI